MYRHRYKTCVVILMMVCLLAGCWSSKEIEDLSIYAGMAMDLGHSTEREESLIKKGSEGYTKQDKVTLTVQIVPVKSFGSKQKTDSGDMRQFNNMSTTGNSILEMLRQYSLWKDRPVIGHHLKVLIVSDELAKKQRIDQIMDFVLRDNDIRPSCLLFLSEGKANETLFTDNPGEIPAFHLYDMVNSRFRTNKILKGFNLTDLDAMMQSRRSFLLQNIVAVDGQTEFSGAGIIKGETCHWVGNLTQEDVSAVNLINGETKGGTIKAYDSRNEEIVYEIKKVVSKIKCNVKGDDISFDVDIKSDGRIIESWDPKEDPSTVKFMKKAEKLFEEEILRMINEVMRKTQKVYKADVIGFSKSLSISKPKVWKKVKDRWDDLYANIPVHVNVKLTITDFGSSTQ